jgi:hypothetical protein
MRPQFRFLVYYGRKNPRVNLVENLDRFFYDMEKVVSGDASVWGEPVVIDGVPVLPEVECLVPSWLRQEYLERTAFLALPAGQHYVYPGVRSPLLLPTDYIREYVFFSCVWLLLLELLWLRSKLAYYVTAFAPLWTDQRLLALRMGGHVLSRHFRYYVPDVSGQSTVQTPVVVR